MIIYVTQTQQALKQTQKQLTNVVHYNWKRLAETAMAMEKTTTKITKTIGPLRKNRQEQWWQNANFEMENQRDSFSVFLAAPDCFDGVERGKVKCGSTITEFLRISVRVLKVS